MLTKRYVNAERVSGLWGNAALALLKGIVGWLSGSKALLADAFRSAADASAAIAKLAGARSGKPETGGAKTSYAPRTEEIATILLSAVMLIIGLEIGISALRDLTEGIDRAPHWSALAAIVAGMLVKELFFRDREGHSSLYSSVAALIGVGGALIGKAASLPLLYYFDPAAAIVIAVLIIHGGYRHIASIVRTDRGQANAGKEAEELMHFVQRVEGVITVESLKAKEQGHYVIADIVISVNPRISVLEGHEIGRRVKQLVMKRFAHVTDVAVSVEPYDPGYPYKSNHDPNQEHMPTLLQ